MKLNQLKNKQGFTLIELSIVLVIIGVVLAGVFVTASSAMNNNKKQQLLQEAVQIVQNSKNMFSNNSSVSGFDTQAIVNSGAAPAQYVATVGSNQVIKHPFTITPATDNITAGNSTSYYAISFNGVPKDACVQLITNIAGSQDLMSKNVINGVLVADGSGDLASSSAFGTITNTNTGSTAPNAGNIAGACNLMSSGKGSVAFQFQP